MNTRFELDARFTPMSWAAFRAFEAQDDAMEAARSLVNQGFGWVRVQRASVWSIPPKGEMVEPTAIIFEHGAAS